MNNPKHSSMIAWRDLQGRVVILELKGKRFFHQLNEVGSFIWRQCDGKSSVEQVARALEREYDVELSKALDDTQVFLDSLNTLGLVEWS